MAANGVRAGHQVTVWNRSPGPVDVFLKTHGQKPPKTLAG
ncbi:MAG: hypothetical protein Q8S27_02310 [Hoeflea sp.]|nr:hypothetical protein [Hoeflea sp.]MDP2122590.1 hypothetical protein [Hoeflea sp.]MDP3523384.1 hypothetical protein [Hoeflea sp.]